MNNAEVFDEIYREKHWPLGLNQSDGIYSGAGSLPENTAEYERIVADLILTKGIASVVDLGCGDFQVSKRILDSLRQLSGCEIEYTGVDVSSLVVKRNQELFGGKGRRFVQADATNDEIPTGDLLLCREVLQHLSNASVRRVIGQLDVFSFALISNATPRNVSNPNQDIRTGPSTRMKIGSSLELTQPPFSLNLSEVLRVPHTKDPSVEIVTELWERDRGKTDPT